MTPQEREEIVRRLSVVQELEKEIVRRLSVVQELEKEIEAIESDLRSLGRYTVKLHFSSVSAAGHSCGEGWQVSQDKQLASEIKQAVNDLMEKRLHQLRTEIAAI